MQYLEIVGKEIEVEIVSNVFDVSLFAEQRGFGLGFIHSPKL